MCGFVTIFSDRANQLEVNNFVSMVETISHRGPDDYGYAFIGPKEQHIWRDNGPKSVNFPGIIMGHRRLSIVDLSENGRQPFISKDKRFWAVYNGEVFNYVELREELRRLGHSFSTETDTEVVIEAYREWGTSFLNRLNGMWAMIIWDNVNKTLLVTRDRFGIKPLFYCQINGCWLFASEVKALLKHPSISSQPQNRSIFRFLWTERSPEPEETYFKDIASLEAASYMLIKEGGVEKNCYWQLPDYSKIQEDTNEDVSAQFLKLFRDSVRLRLRSDVRVGTMMSGGLDSTSIVKTINDLLSEKVEETTSLRGVQQIISACFPRSNIDETDRVRDIINMLGLTVEQVFPAQENVQDVFNKVIEAMEMPFKTSTPLVQYLLMHRARSLGLVVVLNGHGSDEMLGGYPYRHSALVATEFFLKFQLARWHREMKVIKEMHNTGYKEFIYTLLFNSFPSIGAWARDMFRVSKKDLFHKESFRKYKIRSSRLFDRETGGRTVLDRRLRREFFGEVLPVWLAMEDRVSMSASVESRLPFMDYRLVEFAFGLKDTDKIKNGITKYVLRNAMQDKLPSSIVNEKYKYYFSGPELNWMRNSLRPILNKILIEEKPMISEFMRPEKINELVTRVVEKNEGDLWDQRTVWRMLMTEAWMRRFFN